MTLVRCIAITSVALLVAVSACGKTNDSPPATYTVRGQIKAMPGADNTMYIHHEAIPSFVNRTGKAVGMMSMSMPFGVAKGIALDGLAAGDKVEFTFSVDWNADPPTQLTSVRKLPPETTLELSGM